MGKLEEEARGERRKGYLQDAVLGTVAVAGILAVAMIAPNTLQLLGGMGGRKRRLGEQARTALGRLAEKGHVRFEKRDGKSFARITPAGQKALALHEQMAALRIKKGKDGISGIGSSYSTCRNIVELSGIVSGIRCVARDSCSCNKAYGYIRMIARIWSRS